MIRSCYLDETLIVTLADSIREKTKNYNQISIIDMPIKISSIMIDILSDFLNNTMTDIAISVSSIGDYAFYNTSVNSIIAPTVISIGSNAFTQCHNLHALILESPTLCILKNIDAFIDTPIANGEGYVYVPKALEEDYKIATNWSTYTNSIRAIEDYPNIIGGV